MSKNRLLMYFYFFTFLVILASPTSSALNVDQLVNDQAVGPIASFTYTGDWGTDPLDTFQWTASSYDNSYEYYTPFFIPVSEGGVLTLNPTTNMSGSAIPADTTDLTPYRELKNNDAVVTSGFLDTVPVQLLLILPDEVELKNGTTYTEADVEEYMMSDFLPNVLLLLGDNEEAQLNIGEHFLNFEASSEDYYFYLTYYKEGILSELLYHEKSTDRTFYLSYDNVGGIYHDPEFEPFSDEETTSANQNTESNDAADANANANFLLLPVALGALIIRRRKQF